MKKGKREDVSTGLLMAFAISFLVFIYAPLDLYFSNNAEFWFDVYSLFPTILGLFLVCFLILAGINFCCAHLGKKGCHAILVMEMILYLCTYVQGSFLVNHLPPTDGSYRNFAYYAEGRIGTVVLWLLMIPVVTTAAILLKEHLLSAIRLIGICMSLMFCVTLCSEAYMNHGLKAKTDYVISSDHALEMSQDTNFVILLLDAVDSRAFAELLDSHPEYRDVFADFTYYQNMISGYPYTKHCVPLLLSGEWYENERPFSEYITQVYQSELFQSLKERGYRMDFYENDSYVQDDLLLQFDNIKEVKLTSGFYLKLIKPELKLIALRYVPHDLKRFFIVKKTEFDELRNDTDADHTHPFGQRNDQFLQFVKENDMTVNQPEKQFKFFHVDGGHVPFCYDADANMIDYDKGSYRQNVEASMTVAGNYLQKLKDNGVYDNTVLLVMADHGYSLTDEYESWGRQCPLVLIKGVGEHHDTMQLSEAPVAQEDLAAAYLKLLDGAAGSDVFPWKEGDSRDRRYLYYEYDEDEKCMKEYLQTGHAWDLTTLQATGNEYAKKEKMGFFE